MVHAAPERYPDINIRPMTSDDIAAAAALIGETPFWRERFGINTLRAEALLVGAIERNEGLIVGEADGGIIGFSWFLTRGGFGRSGYLRALGVRSDRRNEHAGSALLQATESAVGDDLFVLVPEFNTGARRFYERHSYRMVGRLPGYLLPDSVELLFWRRKLGAF